MTLNDITFWVSPLTHSLYMGTVSKRSKDTANQKRDITGLMVNGIVEFMLSANHASVTVEQGGKKYALTVTEVEGEKA